MAKRDAIQEAMEDKTPYDSVKVGLDRNELFRIFAAMAREDAENAELARVTQQLRKEIHDEWEEDMNGDDIEVIGDEASILKEFQGLLKELEEWPGIDNYSRLKLLQKIRKYGCHLPRERSFKYLINKGSYSYIVALLNTDDFTSDIIRVREALRILKKLVNYAQLPKNVKEGRGLIEALKQRGIVETLINLMKKFTTESYEILKRSLLLLFKFFWLPTVSSQKHVGQYVRSSSGGAYGTVDSEVRQKIIKEGGIVDLLFKVEGFPEYFSSEVINKARAMREELPQKDKKVALAEGRGNSRPMLAEEPPYWDRRGMKISEYYKKRQSEGIPRRQREWDLSSDTGESEDEVNNSRERRRRSSGSYDGSSGDITSYHSFDNFQREGVYSDSSSRGGSAASSFVNSLPGSDFFGGQEDPFKKMMGEDIFAKNGATLTREYTSTRNPQGGGPGGGGGGAPGGGTGFRRRYSPEKSSYVEDVMERQRLLPAKRRGSHEHVNINEEERKEPCCCIIF